MAQRMQAMQLDRPGSPLRSVSRLLPVPNSDELLIQASACGVCRTDLHVCDGDIHGVLPSFPYSDLWGERSIVSVANLTRSDGGEFLALAAEVPVKTTTTAFPLADANEALDRLRQGCLEGAAVLVPGN